MTLGLCWDALCPDLVLVNQAKHDQFLWLFDIKISTVSIKNCKLRID
jgi:hypothetical protein